MPDSAAFCVVCGRSDVATVDGVCADCFAKSHPLVRVPERPTVVLCPTCGARKIGQHWERSGSPTLLGAEDLNRFLTPLDEVGIRRVRWEETSANPLLHEYDATVSVRFRGNERDVGVRTTVKVEHHTCPECSRRSGHYYTSLLQLRAASGGPHESPRVLRARLDDAYRGVEPEFRSDWRKAFSWKEERPEGWDFYLTDTTAARAVARFLKGRWGAELKESATLWGRKGGEDVYRVTFCIRLPMKPSTRAPGTAATVRSPRPKRPVERQS